MRERSRKEREREIMRERRRKEREIMRERRRNRDTKQRS